MASTKDSKGQFSPTENESPQDRLKRFAVIWGEVPALVNESLEEHGLQQGIQHVMESGLIPANWSFREDGPGINFEIGHEIVQLLSPEGTILFVTMSGQEFPLHMVDGQLRCFAVAARKVVKAYEAGTLGTLMGWSDEKVQTLKRETGLYMTLHYAMFSEACDQIRAEAGSPTIRRRARS
jgi:hypothetical protein